MNLRRKRHKCYHSHADERKMAENEKKISEGRKRGEAAFVALHCCFPKHTFTDRSSAFLAYCF